MRSRSRQLTLDDARPITGRGGWRPHAGRPRGRTTVAHASRELFRASEPLLVTLGVRDDVPNLRTRACLAIVHEAIRAAQRAAFRIVHFHLLRNHLHLILEAENRQVLASGMRSLDVALTRNLNRLLRRTGKLFRERFHHRVLPTPTEVRIALRYVLLNGNRHELQRGATNLWFGADPYSSAAWFDGWSDDRYLHEVPDVVRPTVPAQTWLLREGWRRGGGPIDYDDTPGAPNIKAPPRSRSARQMRHR